MKKQNGVPRSFLAWVLFYIASVSPPVPERSQTEKALLISVQKSDQLKIPAGHRSKCKLEVPCERNR